VAGDEERKTLKESAFCSLLEWRRGVSVADTVPDRLHEKEKGEIWGTIILLSGKAGSREEPLTIGGGLNWGGQEMNSTYVEFIWSWWAFWLIKRKGKTIERGTVCGGVGSALLRWKRT